MAPYEFYNEEGLIDSLKEKDQKAFRHLYDNYSSALYGVIVTIIGDDSLSSDILQETFVKIWKNFDSYDAGKGRLYTWMINIARNSAIDYLRSSGFKKQKTTIELSDVSERRGFAGNTPKVEQIGLQKIVSELDQKLMKVIDLSYFKGYTQDEIAKELNIPIGTVKTRSRNALYQLKKIFLK